MAWINIVATDLDQYLVGAQATALREVALADGQADPFAATMQDRCNYIRNRIAGVCTLDTTAYSVPPELKTVAVLLVIEAMQGRLLLALTDDQRRMIDRSYKDLDLAADGNLRISSAADAAAAPQAARPAFNSRTLVSTRDQQDGL